MRGLHNLPTALLMSRYFLVSQHNSLRRFHDRRAALPATLVMYERVNHHRHHDGKASDYSSNKWGYIFRIGQSPPQPGTIPLRSKHRCLSSALRRSTSCTPNAAGKPFLRRIPALKSVTQPPVSAVPWNRTILCRSLQSMKYPDGCFRTTDQCPSKPP